MRNVNRGRGRGIIMGNTNGKKPSKVELERVRDILFFPLPCHLIDWNWKTEAG
jgi:hypothetical protein